MAVRVLGVAGALRRGSYNRRLLRAAARRLPPEAEWVEYRALKSLPPFDEDDEPAPGPAVEDWREALAHADALLFATPEYNASIPGWLKNAVDWGSRPFADPVLRNKPAAVIGASTGMFGGVWAQAELRKALSTAGARVLDRELPVPNVDEAFDENGELHDADLAAELESIVHELVETAERRQELLGARA